MTDRPIRILIADDEFIVRKSLVMFLEDEEFEVYSTANGAETLKMVGENVIDVGIFDMHLPDMEGEELISRAHALCPEMHCFIHTGSSDYELPESLMQLGITREDVFLKPIVDIRVLTNRIKHVLRAG